MLAECLRGRFWPGGFNPAGRQFAVLGLLLRKSTRSLRARSSTCDAECHGGVGEILGSSVEARYQSWRPYEGEGTSMKTKSGIKSHTTVILECLRPSVRQ